MEIMILFAVVIWLALYCFSFYVIFHLLGYLILGVIVFGLLDIFFAFFFGKGLIFSCKTICSSKKESVEAHGFINAISVYKDKTGASYKDLVTGISSMSIKTEETDDQAPSSTVS